MTVSKSFIPRMRGNGGGDDESNEEAHSESSPEGETDEHGVVQRKKSKGVLLGGTLPTPALCLLDGFADGELSTDLKRFTLPITGLPATLGRSHQNTTDKYFFGLGRSAKAISRQQFRIEYWADIKGASLDFSKTDNKFHYVKADPQSQRQFINPSKKEIPEDGFFVIECLGKNKILVNNHKVDQGQVCYLSSGSTIKTSSFMLYFLTPREASNKFLNVNTTPGTKRKLSTIGSTDKIQVKKNKTVDSSTSNTVASKPTVTTSHRGNWPSLQAELDALSTEELLHEIDTAINDGVWDRRHQVIGSTVAYRAVIAAVLDPSLYHTASGPGVSRGQIMDWIAASQQFGVWVEQMSTKLEAKSYQASITKALVKAEFERTGATGRYIKWLLPQNLRGKGPSPAAATTTVVKKGNTSAQNREEENPDDDEHDSEAPADDDDDDNSGESDHDSPDDDGHHSGGQHDIASDGPVDEESEDEEE
jgi:hypothetical protein